MAAAQEAQNNGLSIDDLVENISALASSGKTPLGLNRWVDTDKPKMEDFNRDNEILDREINALKDNKANLNGDIFTGEISVSSFNIPTETIWDNAIYWGSPSGDTTYEKAQKAPAVFANVNSGSLYLRGTNPDGIWNQLTMTSTPEAAMNIASNASGTNRTYAMWNGFNLPVEYGNWNPVLQGRDTTGSVSNTSSTAIYYKIGRLVFCTFSLGGLTVSSPPAGIIELAGLPFARVGGGLPGLNGNRIVGFSFPAGTLNTSGYVNGSNLVLQITNSGGASISSAVWGTHLPTTSNSAFVFTGSFEYITG